MGLLLPTRVARPARRLALSAVLVSSLLVLGGCSFQDFREFRWAMPEPLTEQAPHILELWRWSWVAALLVGILVWGLIIYCSWRFRRRHQDEVPVQTRYNLPIEVFYTIAPIMMVVVLFYWTVTVQNEILHEEKEPDRTIEVVGQQWSWTFNHGVGQADHTRDAGDDAQAHEPVYDEYVYAAGTASQIPTLVLPEGETVHFNLYSPDVIHSFWVPGFLMKLDVVPGRVNSFQVTPSKQGTFKGKCAELCGTYHSRMLFNVEIVSPEEYEAYLADLEEQGNIADEPLLGGADAYSQEGLDSDDDAQTDGGQQ